MPCALREKEPRTVAATPAFARALRPARYRRARVRERRSRSRRHQQFRQAMEEEPLLLRPLTPKSRCCRRDLKRVRKQVGDESTLDDSIGPERSGDDRHKARAERSQRFSADASPESNSHTCRRYNAGCNL